MVWIFCYGIGCYGNYNDVFIGDVCGIGMNCLGCSIFVYNWYLVIYKY